MVIGLLMLTAIPTVTGISLGISERSKPETAARERAQMRKCTLTVWCAGRSKGKAAVHGGEIVLGHGKMWIQSRKIKPSSPLYPFNGFYLDYPDDERTPPPPTGLVTLVSDSPPLMNWIYVDTETWEVRHGNRTESRPHMVGNFGWTSEKEEDFATEPGGLTLDGEERLVAVEPRKGSVEEAEGRWEVFWDEKNDKMAGVKRMEGRMVLRVSLERAYLEEEIAPKENPDAGKAGQGANPSEGAKATQQQVTKRIINGKAPQPGGGNAVVSGNLSRTEQGSQNGANNQPGPAASRQSEGRRGGRQAENLFTYAPSFRETNGCQRRHYEINHPWRNRRQGLNLKSSFVVYDQL